MEDLNLEELRKDFKTSFFAGEIDRLNKELNLTLNDKANEKKIEDQGAEVETGTPAQLKNLVQKEVVRWKKLVDSAKITAD